MICQPAAMMDAAANLHIAGNLRAGPSMFEAPTTLQFRHSPLDVPLTPKDTQSHVHRNGHHTDVDNISGDFREALRTLSIDRDSISKSKQLFPDNRLDRITDAFKRGEKLLISNDNARPKSRCKTPLTINSLHKVTPTSDNDRNTLKSANHHHTHISDDNMQKIFGEVNAPCLPSVKTDDSNNAHTGIAVGKQGHKTEKKQRKRAKTTVKNKKSKHGRISVPSTGMERNFNKQSSVNSQTALHPTRPRVSSEPLSKLSLSSVLSCAPTSFKNSHTASQMYPNSSCNPIYRDLNSAPSSASKISTSSNTQNVLHYTHSTAASDISNREGALQAQGNTVPLHQTESSRVKSGHSIRSVKTAENINTNENVTKSVSAPLSDFLSLSAKSCSLHPSLKTTSDSTVRRGSTSSNTTENTTKEAALTAIYGSVYQTANRVANQVEELKKAKKIFLSDRQSGTLKENGQEYPCAPPATPNADLQRKYEYVPCMSDIRAQRTVKTRLQVMEKDAQKKKEKQRDAQAKLDKQQMKDREKIVKLHQRREIYALNKIMTELENKRFLEFCNAKGLNKT